MYHNVKKLCTRCASIKRIRVRHMLLEQFGGATANSQRRCSIPFRSELLRYGTKDLLIDIGTKSSGTSRLWVRSPTASQADEVSIAMLQRRSLIAIAGGVGVICTTPWETHGRRTTSR